MQLRWRSQPARLTRGDTAALKCCLAVVVAADATDDSIPADAFHAAAACLCACGLLEASHATMHNGALLLRRKLRSFRL